MKNAYWLAAALLAAHEVDAGYWREWELFGLPGGSDLFVVLHLGIFLLLLWGYEQVVARRRAGAWMSLVLGASGALALALHGALLLLGHPEFRSAVSLVVLASTGAAGVRLVVLAWRELRAERAPAG